MFWRKKKPTYEYVCAKGHVLPMAFMPNSDHANNLYCLQCRVEVLEKWTQENVTSVARRIKIK